MSDERIYESIGYRIKELREERHLSKVELAKGICSPSYLTMIEKGVRSPSTYILRQLAFKLKVTPDVLFDLAVESNALEFYYYIREIFKLFEREDLDKTLDMINKIKKYSYPTIYYKQFIESTEIYIHHLNNKDYENGIIKLENTLKLTYSNLRFLTDIEINIICEQAELLYHLNRCDEAYDLLKKHIPYLPSVFKAIDSEAILTSAYVRIAFTSISLKKYEEALDYINHGIHHCKKNNTYIHLVHLYYLKAEVKYYLKNYDGYTLWLNNARVFDSLTENNSSTLKKMILKRLSKIAI